MAGTVSAFGVPTSPAAANAAAGSPTLNAVPSPPQPQAVPADATLKAYRQLLYAAWQIRKTERDLDRLSHIERIINFSTTAVQQLEEQMRSAGPPVPTLAPPPVPTMPPPAGAVPSAPAAHGPQPPGAPAL